MNIFAALLQLRPGAQWSAPADCTDASRIIWHDKTKPVSQAELDAKLAQPQSTPALPPLEQRLARLGLSLEELRAALAASSPTVPSPTVPSPAAGAGTTGAGTTGAGTTGAGTTGAGTSRTVPNFNTMTIPQMQAWAHERGIAVTALAGNGDAKAWAAFLRKAAAG